MTCLLMRSVLAAAAKSLHCSASFSSLVLRPLYPAVPGRAVALRQPSLVLQPLLANNHLLYLQPAFGMKTKGVIKRRCKDCYIVCRSGNLYVYCKTNPKHKQRKLLPLIKPPSKIPSSF
uniref:Ribosomal protein n=1 Tax=Sphenodon punctatus TaxID=8508 RepID=A0A8D0GJ59_SPHPU